LDDIVTSLIVVGVTGIVVIAIFWLSNKTKKEKSLALRAMADKHGWRYSPIAEPLTWGSKICDNNWELIAESRSIGQVDDSGSSNIHQSTIWKGVLNSSTKGELLIGPRPLAYSMGKNKNLPVMTMGLKEIQPDNYALSERYLFLGNPDFDLNFLSNSTISRQLLEFPPKITPLIHISFKSVEITIQNTQLETPEELEKLILLGESFLLTI
jgi:hypothetical protein